jgi:hypothetical protein
MSGTIVFTIQNCVDLVNNNAFEYKFPTSVKFDDCEIAVAQASLYYSWYNISASLNNNSFNFTFPNQTQKTITIPDGQYQITDLNNYLQYLFPMDII